MIDKVMNKKLEIECSRIKIACTKYREKLRKRDEQKKLGLDIFWGIFSVSLMLLWIKYVFYPILDHIQAYEKIPNYDPVLILSSFGFACLGLWFVGLRFPTIIYDSLAQILGRCSQT